MVGELQRGRDESAGRRAGGVWVGVGMPGFPRAREFTGTMWVSDFWWIWRIKDQQVPKVTREFPTLVGIAGNNL